MVFFQQKSLPFHRGQNFTIVQVYRWNASERNSILLFYHCLSCLQNLRSTNTNYCKVQCCTFQSRQNVLDRTELTLDESISTIAGYESHFLNFIFIGLLTTTFCSMSVKLIHHPKSTMEFQHNRTMTSQHIAVQYFLVIVKYFIQLGN